MSSSFDRNLERALTRRFYARPAEIVAPALLGRVLVRRLGRREYRAKIVETEAYLGPKDLASHASKGVTPRTRILFGPAGHAYVYFIYGMHYLLNFVAGSPGSGQAVLIRAAEPLDGWQANLTGPARLARAMGIGRSENGIDVTGGGLFVSASRVCRPEIETTGRVGVDYAGTWKDVCLRFIDGASAAVSKGPSPARPGA